VVGLAHERCDQENVIEQLKNGVHAMRLPVDDLVSNWAYMVMTALAWNLKAWYVLLLPRRRRGLELLRMEFRRFLHAIILLPVQIVRTGRSSIGCWTTTTGWQTSCAHGKPCAPCASRNGHNHPLDFRPFSTPVVSRKTNTSCSTGSPERNRLRSSRWQSPTPANSAPNPHRKLAARHLINEQLQTRLF